MMRMAAHFVGEIRMALDRPVDGIETATASAARAADATTALEPSCDRGIKERMFTPPPPPIFRRSAVTGPLYFLSTALDSAGSPQAS